MDGVRDWLVACGDTFGCREVHHYRWADTDTRPEVPYMTYRAVNSQPEYIAVRGTKESGITGEDPHTVYSGTDCQFLVRVHVDLYNSEFGMGWLAKCAIACEKEQAIKTIFQNSNIGFREIVSIDDMTEFDDERIYYHQRLTILLRTVVTHTHINHNFKVDSVDSSGAVIVE